MPSAFLLGKFQQLEKSGHIKSVKCVPEATYTTLFVEAKGNPAPNEINSIKQAVNHTVSKIEDFSLSS